MVTVPQKEMAGGPNPVYGSRWQISFAYPGVRGQRAGLPGRRPGRGAPAELPTAGGRSR